MNTPDRDEGVQEVEATIEVHAETVEATPAQEHVARRRVPRGDDPLQPADRKDARGGEPQARGPRNVPETPGFAGNAARSAEAQPLQPQAAAPVVNLDGNDYWTKMATATANIVAQALIQSKDLDSKPKHHVGPRPVEQTALPGAP